MTKNERRELDKAAALTAAGHRDMAARTLAIIFRSARSEKTQAAAVQAVYTLNLRDRVSFVESPWGGYKQSGHGREMSFQGQDEFLETKQVHINLSEAPLAWY